uniref:Uncharacterized protein n=1 Tax=Rousettus aegyptiacus TaxID=9407 RepID=A0A7J8DI91_ROUAE|nr:hypothetical protein HJG63_008630 [Rousettus aegyptiacus]
MFFPQAGLDKIFSKRKKAGKKVLISVEFSITQDDFLWVCIHQVSIFLEVPFQCLLLVTEPTAWSESYSEKPIVEFCYKLPFPSSSLSKISSTVKYIFSLSLSHCLIIPLRRFTGNENLRSILTVLFTSYPTVY